jgi:glutathione S-transferase
MTDLMALFNEAFREFLGREHDNIQADISERNLCGRLDAALSWLEELAPSPWLFGNQMSRADVTAAIAFTYLIEKHRNFLERRPSPALEAHCRHCEALPQFASAAYSASEAERSGWYAEK